MQHSDDLTLRSRILAGLPMQPMVGESEEVAFAAVDHHQPLPSLKDKFPDYVFESQKLGSQNGFPRASYHLAYADPEPPMMGSRSGSLASTMDSCPSDAQMSWGPPSESSSSGSGSRIGSRRPSVDTVVGLARDVRHPASRPPHGTKTRKENGDAGAAQKSSSKKVLAERLARRFGQAQYHDGDAIVRLIFHDSPGKGQAKGNADSSGLFTKKSDLFDIVLAIAAYHVNANYEAAVREDHLEEYRAMYQRICSNGAQGPELKITDNPLRNTVLDYDKNVRVNEDCPCADKPVMCRECRRLALDCHLDRRTRMLRNASAPRANLHRL